MKAYIRGQTDGGSFSFPSAYYTYKVRKVFILSSNYLHNAFIIPATCVCPLKANWWDEVDPAKESSSDWTDWTIRASVAHTHRERERERGGREREGGQRGGGGERGRAERGGGRERGRAERGGGERGRAERGDGEREGGWREREREREGGQRQRGGREREREREREGRDRGGGERERERGGGERERETVVPREVQRMCPVIINQAAADWRLWPSSSESFSSSGVWTLLNAEHTEGKSNGLWQSSRTACKTQRSSTSTAAICPHPTKDRLFDSRDTAATCHYLIKSLVVSAHHSSPRFFSHYLDLPP